MKKMILLCALVCASQMYGMEQPTEKHLSTKELEIYKSLLLNLPELQKKITETALSVSNNLPETVKTIQQLSALHGVQYANNLKDFTALVHLLGSMYNMAPYAVALKFYDENAYHDINVGSSAYEFYGIEKPIITQYVELFSQFINAIENANTTEAKKSIDQGVDIAALPKMLESALGKLIFFGTPTIEMITLLLSLKEANITKRLQEGLNFIKNSHSIPAIEYEQMKSLADEAIKKQSTVAK